MLSLLIDNSHKSAYIFNILFCFDLDVPTPSLICGLNGSIFFQENCMTFFFCNIFFKDFSCAIVFAESIKFLKPVFKYSYNSIFWSHSCWFYTVSISWQFHMLQITFFVLGDRFVVNCTYEKQYTGTKIVTNFRS